MHDYDRQKVDEAGHRTMVEADYSQRTEPNQWSSLTRMAHISLLDNAEKLRFLIARNTLAMIDEALASPTPLIVEGERYFAKLEECENEKKSLTDERNRLDAELQDLSAEILGLRGQHDECKRQLEECQRQRHIHPFRPP
jgi:predicted nuclease with TOPRIM domain